MWAIVVFHEITKERYVVGPFEHGTQADLHCATMRRDDSARTCVVVRFVQQRSFTLPELVS